MKISASRFLAAFTAVLILAAVGRAGGVNDFTSNAAKSGRYVVVAFAVNQGVRAEIQAGATIARFTALHPELNIVAEVAQQSQGYTRSILVTFEIITGVCAEEPFAYVNTFLKIKPGKEPASYEAACKIMGFTQEDSGDDTLGRYVWLRDGALFMTATRTEVNAIGAALKKIGALAENAGD